MPTAELAIARVLSRVGQGGHDVPEEVIRRRYDAGLRNFRKTYQKLVNSWIWIDNAGAEPIKALRRAARRALQIGLETGTPVYVIKRGKIVDLTLSYRGKTKGKSKTKDHSAVVARAKK